MERRTREAGFKGEGACFEGGLKEKALKGARAGWGRASFRAIEMRSTSILSIGTKRHKL
jgi:hypothetical protein